MTETKRCTKCGEEKPLSEFYRNQKTHDGRASQCKGCRLEYARKHYEENGETIRERARKYREENREAVLEYERKIHRENREREAEYARNYYRKNRKWKAGYDLKYNKCVKTPTCPLVGANGAEFVVFTCEACGTEFRRLKSSVDCDYERRGSLPRFCSLECRYASQRKDYKSPYARNIERIKKEVAA